MKLPLPRIGLWNLAGFYAKAEDELAKLIKGTRFTQASSKEELIEGSEYVIANQYLKLIYERYGQETANKFVDFMAEPKMLEIINDLATLELQKTLEASDGDALRHKHKAAGIAEVVKFAEKLEMYKITVKLFENKHGKPEEGLVPHESNDA